MRRPLAPPCWQRARSSRPRATTAAPWIMPEGHRSRRRPCAPVFWLCTRASGRRTATVRQDCARGAQPAQRLNAILMVACGISNAAAAPWIVDLEEFNPLRLLWQTQGPCEDVQRQQGPGMLGKRRG